MRILQIAPTFFDDISVIGGAERYTWELARALARQAEVTHLTFGPRAHRETRDGVHLERLRWLPGPRHPLMPDPLNPGFAAAIRRADVVHCHQVDVMPTNAAVVLGRLLRRPVFVTDLGGGFGSLPSNVLPIMRWAAGYLLISEYSKRLWLEAPRTRRPDSLEVIYGGVDVDRFSPGGRQDPSMVLYVGRLLPHKGVEHLIDAVAPPLRLHLVGRPYDTGYLAMLRDRARGKPVVFEHDVDDHGLVDRYRSALVSVLPSVSTDWRGHVTDKAELFGLAVVEAMACGTPAIVSRTASLPELVDDGVTGFVVPPADATTLGARLRELQADPSRAAAMGLAARRVVAEKFTWTATAERCLRAYRRVSGPA